MSQGRDAPAYQEYAAGMLSRWEFRTLTLEERGLLWTMRLECWVNKQLPADEELLSTMLGRVITKSMVQSLSRFFQEGDGFLTMPDLEAYREYLAAIRAKQSTGGKAGAELTNKRRRGRNKSSVTGKPPSDPRLAGESLVQSSSVQSSSVKHSNQEWDNTDQFEDVPF